MNRSLLLLPSNWMVFSLFCFSCRTSRTSAARIRIKLLQVAAELDTWSSKSNVSNRGRAQFGKTKVIDIEHASTRSNWREVLRHVLCGNCGDHRYSYSALWSVGMPNFRAILTENSAFYDANLYIHGLCFVSEWNSDLPQFAGFSGWSSSRYNFLGFVKLESRNRLQSEKKILTMCVSLFSRMTRSIIRTAWFSIVLSPLCFFDFVDLPNLEEIQFGWNSMTQLTSLTFTQLPKLAKIESQYGTTSERSNPANYGTMKLEDLPELQEISLRGNALMDFDTVILQNLPKFFHFDYAGKSDGYTTTMRFIGEELHENFECRFAFFWQFARSWRFCCAAANAFVQE